MEGSEVLGDFDRSGVVDAKCGNNKPINLKFICGRKKRSADSIYFETVVLNSPEYNDVLPPNFDHTGS